MLETFGSLQLGVCWCIGCLFNV